MAIRRSLTQIIEAVERRIVKSGEFYLDRQPAFLGNYSRVVEVPNKNGIVYARLQSGQVVEVLNNVAPNIHNWSVYVGHDKSQPKIFKVLETRWIHNARDVLSYVLFHHKQHEFPEPDTVFIYRDQFMPLLVFPAGGLTVKLYGDVIFNVGMANPVRIDDEVFDLTSYVPSSGATYVLMEIDATGAVNFVTGASYASREILWISGSIPQPTTGSIPLCAIVLYLGQETIRRDRDARDIIDLRMFASGAGDAHVHSFSLDDLTDVNAPSPSTGDALVFDGTEWIPQVVTGSGSGKALKIVMKPDLIDPPEPVLNVEGDDYVYYEVDL